MSTKKSPESIQNNEYCFAIMPISDVDSHPKGHFSHVYQDIIVPACEKAGFTACRADDVKATNLIQLDILKKLIDAPIAICDLSTRNPNVLFELGIRQAFDKPVVLIQEVGTPPIFDISGLRYLQYSKEMKYHEVLHTQNELTSAIKETMGVSKEENNINSIVKLLALSSKAQIPDLKGNQDNLAFNVIQTEIRSLKNQMLSLIKSLNNSEYTQQNSDFFQEKNVKNREIDLNKKFLMLEKEFITLSHSEINFQEKLKLLNRLIDRIEIAQKDTDLILPPWEELPQKFDNLKRLIMKQIEDIL